MWYTLPDSNKQYPVAIERVRKIKQLNAQGVIPEELEAVDLTTNKPKESESGFVELVGQISLNTLEKADRGRNRPQQGSRGNNQRNAGPQQQRGPSSGQRPAGNPGQAPRGNQPPQRGSSNPAQPRSGNAPQQPRSGNQQRPPGGQQPPRGDNNAGPRKPPGPPIKKKP